MKSTIEEIWREGFLNENALVAPKINNLYQQKSMHIVERVKRKFNFNLVIIIGTAIALPILYFFMHFFWQGAVGSVLLLLYGWYFNHQIKGLETLDQGATSLDYLWSLDAWMKDIISRAGRIAHVSYPVFSLIAISVLWSAWTQQEKLVLLTREKFSNSIFIGNMPLFVWFIAGLATLLLYYFSGRLWKWEVRLMYGPILDKLKQTIEEMEELKQDNIEYGNEGS